MIWSIKECRKKFRYQKAGAKKRGIGFELTFEEWLRIWVESGHFNEIGTGFGKYVMARFGDKGPYAIGNVKIILHTENSREAMLGNKFGVGNKGNRQPRTVAQRSAFSARLLGNKYTLGYKFTAEQRANVRAGKLRRRERERQARGLSS